MIDAIATPEGIATIIAGVGAAVGAGYYYSQHGGEVEADIDGDNEAEVTFGSGQGLDEAAEDATEETAEGEKVSADIEEQGNPTPDHIQDIGNNLTEIKGIGDTRAKAFNEAGYETAADLYYASDENLEAVHGIGSKAVSDIREDIGSVGQEGNDGESSDGSDEQEPSDEKSSSENEKTSEDEKDDGTESTESEDQTDGSGSTSDEEVATEA